MKYIWIRFSSPLVSCGGDAQSFSVRGTSELPTYSEILGLLAASLGISYRKDSIAVKGLRDGILMDIYPVQKGTLLRDFQGAGGGILKGTSDYLDRCIPRDNSGSKNKIYEKEYLQDSKFDIVLRVASEELTTKLVKGLQNPKWMLFAGRKACHLTEVPLGGVFDSQDEVAEAWSLEGRLHPYTNQIHVPPGTLGAIPIEDFPICAGDNRVSVRYVTTITS